MKLLFSLGLITFCILCTNCNTSRSSLLENDQIGLSYNYSEELLLVMDDVSKLLSEYPNGKNIFSAIQLSLDLSSHLDSLQIQRNEEVPSCSFYISSNNNKQTIYSKNQKGLTYGLYFFLEQLGFRFYFPGDLWTHKPNKLKQGLRLDTIVMPEFKNINFFGSGGLPSHQYLDPNNQRKTLWNQWKQRMRFGNDLLLSGHAGEAFNAANKDVLKNNPDYLAQIKGKRVPFSRQAKLCISNQQALDLFVRDRMNEYRNKKTMNGADPISISVEPADGSNHCTCSKCLKMGTVSDRVFYVANLIAQKIKTIDADDYVNLYAYNEHAQLPHNDLQSNVIVTVVPYAFQHISAPEKLLTDWRTKTDKLYIYEYIGIPAWEMDIPSIPYLTELKPKIDFWKSEGISGIELESSFSIGATAIPLYIINKMSWNLETNPEKELDELSKNLFKSASEPISRLLSRWAGDYDIRYDIPSDLWDLKEAYELVDNDPLVTQRIVQLKAYVHYLVLLNEFLENPNKSKDDFKNLLTYVWSLNESLLINSSAISNILLQQFAQRLGVDKEKWSYFPKKIKPSAWTGVKNVSKEIIKTNFNRDFSKYEKLMPELRQNIVSSGTNNTANSYTREKNISFTIAEDQIFELKKTENDSLRFECSAIDLNKKSPGSIISLYNQNKKLINSYTVPRNNKTTLIDWSNVPTGTYTLSFSVKRCELKFMTQDQFPTLLTSRFNCVDCPPNFCFIPAHDNEIIHAGKFRGKNNLAKKLKSPSMIKTQGEQVKIKGIEKGIYETINGNGKFVL